MRYSKKDAQMTKGLAITSMLLLHLFCRQGKDVFGVPLLWIDDKTPFVYYIGFFSEICVPLYSICVGYGQQFLYENGKNTWKKRLDKIRKVIINYWTVLILFAIVSVFVIPGEESLATPIIFIKNMLLLDTYNGSWWYLHSYIFILLVPTYILLWIPNRMNMKVGIAFFIMFQFVLYFINRFNILDISSNSVISQYISTEITNLIGILAGIWTGAWFCKYRIIEKSRIKFLQLINKRKIRIQLLTIIFIILFVSVNLIHKAILFLPVTIVVFVIFNLWEKNDSVERIFLFLGKHSTNIWLAHMFFYAYIFKNLVMIAKYPLFMFAFMLLLCYITSFIVMEILKVFELIISKQ